jgi:hypothetical protein
MLQHPSPPGLLVAAIDTQGNYIAFTINQQMHNSKLQTSYDDMMEKYDTLHEKACGDLMKFIAPSQRVHVKGLEGNAPGMWAALIVVHLQQAPGTWFSAYNELFDIIKGPNEPLTHLVSCVSDAMGRIKELRPATNFDTVKLDEELQLMAMLRALPRAKYGNFTPSLMCTEELTLTHAKAAFHGEETKRNTVHVNWGQFTALWAETSQRESLIFIGLNKDIPEQRQVRGKALKAPLLLCPGLYT